MKIIHTSDWHIGHILYNWDRSEEHQSFFDWLTGLVREEMPDALLISGDIYHTAAPSASAERLLIENMLRIHKACPEMTIVMTAGNHDSSARLETDKELWKHFNTFIRGSVTRELDLMDSHIIEVGSPAKGYVLAVPHCYPQNFPELEEGIPREDRPAAFFRTMLDRIAQINKDNLPVAVMAHSTFTGSDPKKQDIIVGGLDSMNAEDLGDGYDYLALGHIHYPQNISDRARYSGSPLPVSFNEDYSHSVSIIETGSRRDDINIRVCEVPVLRPVITLPEEAVPFEEALKFLEDFPEDKEGYIRLNVKVDKYGGADWSARAEEAAKGKKCRYCCMLLQSEDSGTDSGNAMQLSREEMKEMNPLDIARLYWKEINGNDMTGELEEKLIGVIMEKEENR